MKVPHFPFLNERAVRLLTRTVKGREIGVCLLRGQQAEIFDREVDVVCPYETEFWVDGDLECSEYNYSDGFIYREFIQKEPDGFPYYGAEFWALKDGDGNVVVNSLWTEEEIREREEDLQKNYL